MAGEDRLVNKPTEIPTASVVVVTKDRPELLDRLLASLVEQTRMPEEVLVVDNNSSVSYEETIARYRNSLPLRVVIEKTPGIPHARNRGWREAMSEIVIFTDDDCVAEPDWVERMLAPFTLNPHIGAVGGEILSDERAGTWIESFCAAETLMRMGRPGEDEA